MIKIIVIRLDSKDKKICENKSTTKILCCIIYIDSIPFVD